MAGQRKQPWTRRREIETAAVLALVCLGLGFWLAQWWLGAIVGSALVLGTLAVPAAVRPILKGAQWLAQAVGAVMSRVLLSVIFWVAFTPVALIRRLAGKSAPSFRTDGTQSTLIPDERDITPEDLTHPW